VRRAETFAQVAARALALGATLGATVAVVALAASGCGGAIPASRYGVAEVDVQGLETLDDAALEACLGTQRIATPGFDVGASSGPDCNVPPFDGRRLRIDLWPWPWTQWPLFDESVFERDQQRVTRWLRARGHYEGRIVETRVEPPEALASQLEGLDHPPCADDDHGCEVRVHLRVEEGPPVLVARVEIHGADEIPDDLRRELRSVIGLRRGVRFDETVFDQARDDMVRRLADRAFVDARVEGQVKIDVPRHEAFVAFVVETGQPAVLGRICVYGNASLPARPILGATYLEPGSRFSLSELEEAQRAIYALGTFASVEIRHRAPTEEEVRSETVDPETGEVDLRRTTEVPNPEPITDPEAEPAEEGEPTPSASTPPAEPADPQPEQPSICRPLRTEPPAGTRVVDLDVRVTPGRLERMGVGVGLQAGNTLQFTSAGASTSTGALASNQWDVHILFAYEHRNVFDDMLRVRLEERPRLICPNQFPACDLSGIEQRVPVGNQIALDVRWPAFLEPRMSMVGGVTHDYGPAPFLNFFRHELDGRLGLERAFFDGRLYFAGGIRGNLFFPDDDQRVRVRSLREETRALILEQGVYLDLRDQPRDPRSGAYFAVALQEGGFGGLSSWDYIRLTAEARGYIPLPAGIVLALRFGIGGMFVLGSYGLDPQNVYGLAGLGPFSQQLTGGGPISNRGYPAGFMGDAERRTIETRPTPDGIEERAPILVSGGVRRWEASLELRVPITPDIGIALFADAGDVTRQLAWRFDHPQIAVGGGLRLRTFVGIFRLDVAGRPDALQVFGASTLPPDCRNDFQTSCRPVATVFGWFPGAVHLTLGEAF
jgi:hypothetical protein